MYIFFYDGLIGFGVVRMDDSGADTTMRIRREVGGLSVELLRQHDTGVLDDRPNHHYRVDLQIDEEHDQILERLGTVGVKPHGGFDSASGAASFQALRRLRVKGPRLKGSGPAGTYSVMVQQGRRHVADTETLV